MHDLGFVRANLELVENKLRERGADPAELLGDFRRLDEERREKITRLETLKGRRNELSEQVGALKRAKQDATALMEEVRALKETIDADQQAADAIDEQMRSMLTRIPNLCRDEVPVGRDERDNVEVKRWGKMPEFDFAPKPHWELGAQLGILDLERAAKISGARFAVYWGDGARLERALIGFMLDLHTREHGYTEVLPPFMVNADSMFGTGQLPKFEQDLFKVPMNRFERDEGRDPFMGEQVMALDLPNRYRVLAVNGSEVELLSEDAPYQPPYSVPRTRILFRRDFYLIPTAEVPVTNLYRDETLDEAKLPVSLTAYTPCFRSEAGSYGKDVRGIIRQHQFQKVELVKFARPEESDTEHEKLTRNAETILERLELPYRRMLLCTGDTGFSAAKTFDLEVWLPGQGLYREISSCSNFEAFQARRANIRYKPKGQGKTAFLHTLNGSGLAVGRTWLAILENYQQADGTVKVPEALVPYMGGLRTIEPRAGA